jgi:anthraniloyl-CoA monooxygenase
MNVHVIGGGPAGLYFAILMKKAWPQTRITVFERNKPDDTFGFGVVFSDQTLEAFESYDRETYRQIVGHFAYWDDIEIHFRGTTHRIGGNGFCGTSRSHAAENLGRRAHSLGIDIKYGSEADPGEADHPRRRSGGRRRRHQLAHPRGCSRTSSSRPLSCAPTTSPGWARSGRWTPSTSSSRRRRTASSSRIATSTSPATRPG